MEDPFHADFNPKDKPSPDDPGIEVFKLAIDGKQRKATLCIWGGIVKVGEQFGLEIPTLIGCATGALDMLRNIQSSALGMQLPKENGAEVDPDGDDDEDSYFEN